MISLQWPLDLILVSLIGAARLRVVLASTVALADGVVLLMVSPRHLIGILARPPCFQLLFQLRLLPPISRLFSRRIFRVFGMCQILSWMFVLQVLLSLPLLHQFTGLSNLFLRVKL